MESGVKELLSTIVVLEVRDIHPEAGDSLIGQRAGAGMKSSSGASVAWMSNFEGCVLFCSFVCLFMESCVIGSFFLKLRAGSSGDWLDVCLLPRVFVGPPPGSMSVAPMLYD